MILEKFSFYIGKKKLVLKVKRVSVLSTGLLCRKKSPCLLWEVGKEKKIDIFSLFCRPFVAVWLDKNKKAIKISSVKTWKLKISGFGKFLLEIPESDGNYLKMTKRFFPPTGKKRKV